MLSGLWVQPLEICLCVQWEHEHSIIPPSSRKVASSQELLAVDKVNKISNWAGITEVKNAGNFPWPHLLALAQFLWWQRNNRAWQKSTSEHWRTILPEAPTIFNDASSWKNKRMSDTLWRWLYCFIFHLDSCWRNAVGFVVLLLLSVLRTCHCFSAFQLHLFSQKESCVWYVMFLLHSHIPPTTSCTYLLFPHYIFRHRSDL